jgi:hypothetical protein
MEQVHLVHHQVLMVFNNYSYNCIRCNWWFWSWKYTINKINAPLDYAAQGRCVTVDDYKTYTKKLFANTQAVSVWGGEDGSYDTSTGVSSNPEYGKVFISIKSTTGENLTTVQKSNLVQHLLHSKLLQLHQWL